MAKLKTYAVITKEEYHQAQAAGRFLIADKLSCAYCSEPLTVSENPEYLYCRQHDQLAVSMYWYPGYPSVPIETPRYGQMDFFFSQLERNRPLLNRLQHKYIATEKGCPFCDRYMPPVDATLEEQRDASLLNQQMCCPECGVSFLIEVIAPTGSETDGLQMRFTPEEKYLRKETEQTWNNIEHRAEHRADSMPAPQQDVEPDAEITDNDIARQFIETHIVAADTEHFQRCDELYTAYQRFAETRKRTPLEDRKLYARLREGFPVEKTRRRVDGQLVYGFTGIRCQKRNNADG